MSEGSELEVELRFIESSDPLFEQVRKLRHDVLVHGFELTGDIDWHDDDAASSHVVALEDGRVVAYGRMIAQGDVVQARHITVAPDRQRTGLGTVIMAALVTEARNRGMRSLWLNSRMKAVPFYRRLGFRQVGDVFVPGHVNLEHVRMELEL